MAAIFDHIDWVIEAPKVVSLLADSILALKDLLFFRYGTHFASLALPSEVQVHSSIYATFLFLFGTGDSYKLYL